MVYLATKPEYNGLKQGQRATSAHFGLAEIRAESPASPRRCNEPRKRRRGNSDSMKACNIHTKPYTPATKTMIFELPRAIAKLAQYSTSHS